jgi:hypothetical protein
MVEVNELHRIGKRRHHWLERRMVESGSAMQQQQGRDLAHPTSLRAELRAFDIEEDARTA